MAGGRYDSSAGRARSLHLAMLNPWRYDVLALGPMPEPVYPPLPNGRVGAACKRDGLALVVHPRCSGCGVLCGPGHVVETLDGGQCSSCNPPDRTINPLRAA
jgi:hypothetical protein